MVLCDGLGWGFSWIFLVMVVLMFAGCFFVMKRMHGKGTPMDCCAKRRSGGDADHDLPQK